MKLDGPSDVPDGPENYYDLAALRERLSAGRERQRAAHERGVPGIQVCTSLTDLLDGIILDLFQGALLSLPSESEREAAANSVVLVAHGGYGRRDVAPYSDVDLMLVQASGSDDVVAPLARRFSQGVFDIGLQLGFTLRTIRQACQMSLRDATIFTSLAESRYMAGSKPLFDRYMKSFRRAAQRRVGSIVPAVIIARREERVQFGETEYLLEPNVKRSRGGLREIQLIRWIGFARYGHPELEYLEGMGVILPQEKRKLRECREFLLRLRNELHFFAGRAQDVLDKAEQLRIAELRGYPGTEAVLPVEAFMQEYFQRTSYVRYTAAHFGRTAKPASLRTWLFNAMSTRRIGPHYLIGPHEIRATRSGLEKLRGNLIEVLRLLELANLTEKRIHHETWQTVRADMMDTPSEITVTKEVAQQFLSLVSRPGRLGEQLRRLHELHVLEKIVPPVAHTRGLLQFNDYHKFTVDEHSLRAVEAATAMIDDPGSLGEAYRGLERKGLLHLALLLHDLGKGYPQDHSVLGAEMAEDVGRRLYLTQADTETVQLLVLKHLRMAHVAFRENLDDDSIVLNFAVEIGSTDALTMLYLLTCADIASVGPGVLNDWKVRLLTDLYHRAMRSLAGSDFRFDERLDEKREQVMRLVPESEDEQSWWELVESLPTGYLHVREPDEIYSELQQLRELPRDAIRAWGRFEPSRNAVEYSVAAYEEKIDGIFHRLAGALSAKRSQILSAEINTLAGGVVLDRFYVDDLDFNNAPPQSRLEEVSEALMTAADSDAAPKFRSTWDARRRAKDIAAKMPTRVRIDNTTAEHYTIINVFAYDRLGLLYSIARTLFDLGLSVQFAKIATYIDQVVDVFYVTDRDGGKVADSERVSLIRERLLAAAEGDDASDAGDAEAG